MATMEKASIIFGELKQITPMSFNTQHLNEIEMLIQHAIGYDFKIRRAEVSKAIEAARGDPLLKVGYVKVGVVTGNLIMRIKEKSTSGKHWTDTLLVRDFKAKAEAHKPSGTPAPTTPQDKEIDWSKWSVGNMAEEAAERALGTQDDGAWFVRHGLGNALTISVRLGDSFRHVPVAEANIFNLDYTKRLSAEQVGHRQQLNPLHLRELEQMDGFFPKLDRNGAERLLSSAPNGAWLVRGTGRSGEIFWSRKNGTKVEHAAINDDRRFKALQHYRSTAAMQVKP